MGLPRAARRPASFAPLAVVTVVVVLGANACGDDASSAPVPPPLSTATAAPRDAGVEAAPPVDASIVDAGAQARRFVGTLAATKPADFGGPPYCKYRITMKTVDVAVTVTEAGDIANASVSSLAFEETLPPCTYEPVAPNVHKYYLASSLKLPSGGSHLELARDPLNRPEASLVLEGDFRTDTVKAALEWHRTDQKAPLDWRVTTTVTLDRR